MIGFFELIAAIGVCVSAILSVYAMYTYFTVDKYTLQIAVQITEDNYTWHLTLASGKEYITSDFENKSFSDSIVSLLDDSKIPNRFKTTFKKALLKQHRKTIEANILSRVSDVIRANQILGWDVYGS